MTDSLFILRRHEDVSGVSGTGVICSGVEFEDGDVAVHWPGATPSTVIWKDIRHVDQVHGHDGKTVVEFLETDRLLRAYQQVMPFLLQATHTPMTIGPHPDHPDRLRVTFAKASSWDRWLTWLDGSLDSTVVEEVNGEIEHRWVSPDGNLWLVYYTPVGSAWERHDDPEVNR